MPRFQRLPSHVRYPRTYLRLVLAGVVLAPVFSLGLTVWLSRQPFGTAPSLFGLPLWQFIGLVALAQVLVAAQFTWAELRPRLARHTRLRQIGRPVSVPADGFSAGRAGYVFTVGGQQFQTPLLPTHFRQPAQSIPLWQHPSDPTDIAVHWRQAADSTATVTPLAGTTPLVAPLASQSTTHPAGS